MNRLAEGILHLHGWVALAVVFALPALESSVFLGFLFPGEVAVLLGGVLAFQGRVSLPAAIVAAVAGAIIGDTVGYEVGKHFGRRLLRGTIGRVVDHRHLDRAERYLTEKGGKAVFLGRFTAALRVMIPGMAGMAGMEYRTFALYNITGGTIWATGFVLLGYAGGSSYRRVEAIAKRASLLLLLLVVVVGGTVLLARRIARDPARLHRMADRVANLSWPTAVRTRCRRQLDFLLRRFRPRAALGLSLTVSLGLLAVTGWIFGLVVQDVLSGDSFNPLDRPVLDFLVAHREPWLTTFATVASALGSSTVLVPLLVVVALSCRWRAGTWRPAALLGGGYGGAVLLAALTKLAVERPRPPLASAVRHFSQYSFPSSHATQAIVAWGLLAAVAAAVSPTWAWKVAAWATALFMAMTVGATRMYLGAQWFTDVAGGLVLGALWMSAILALVRAVPVLRGPAARPAAGSAGREVVPAGGGYEGQDE
ncbi:MAG: bifunctional DedA family/phosphatase PAP2 family protein [Actinomycetota bacterium]|nr:bifunctional DedA family/phosphatase PAP2 family protein [Actinomycetota bacterium]